MREQTELEREKIRKGVVTTNSSPNVKAEEAQVISYTSRFRQNSISIILDRIYQLIVKTAYQGGYSIVYPVTNLTYLLEISSILRRDGYKVETDNLSLIIKWDPISAYSISA